MVTRSPSCSVSSTMTTASAPLGRVDPEGPATRPGGGGALRGAERGVRRGRGLHVGGGGGKTPLHPARGPESGEDDFPHGKPPRARHPRKEKHKAAVVHAGDRTGHL